MVANHLSELLRSKLAPVGKILLTGASGWIGRETIVLLREALGDDFSQRVTLAGSHTAEIEAGGSRYSVENLAEIHGPRGFELVIHLAYLTQEKSTTLGDDEYSRLNRELTEFVYRICTENRSKYIFVASSGVVDESMISTLTSPSKIIYANLKKEAEERFLALTQKAGATVEIGRIWSISGAQILNTEKYALGDFIAQAKSTGGIEIGSPTPVYRSYIDGGEMMGVFLVRLLSGEGGVLNSGGYPTSLENLAKEILQVLNPHGKVILSTEKAEGADTYLPPTDIFNQIAHDYGIALSNLKEQIRRTANGKIFVS